MTSFELIVSAQVYQQIDEIYSYARQNHSQARASKIEYSILQTLEQLTENPFIHPIETLLNPPDEQIRRAIVGRTYRIIYRVQVDSIVVLAVFHGARNPGEIGTLLS